MGLSLWVCVKPSGGRSPTAVSERSRDESNSTGKSNKHRPYWVQTRTNSHCHVTGQTVTVPHCREAVTPMSFHTHANPRCPGSSLWESTIVCS